MPKDHVPRLSIEITNEQRMKLQQLIPWGLQRPIFSLIVDDLIDLLSKNPEKTLACLLSRAIAPREALPSLNEEDKE